MGVKPWICKDLPHRGGGRLFETTKRQFDVILTLNHKYGMQTKPATFFLRFTEESKGRDEFRRGIHARGARFDARQQRSPAVHKSRRIPRLFHHQ